MTRLWLFGIFLVSYTYRPSVRYFNGQVRNGDLLPWKHTLIITDATHVIVHIVHVRYDLLVDTQKQILLEFPPKHCVSRQK
jgi:hypothetical protein